MRSNPLQIEAEIDWINYLAEGGAGVAGAVSSVNGVFAEKINDGYGGSFIATAFKRAKGFSPWDKKYTCSEEEFSKYYGAAVGKLHHLTKKYKTNHLKQTRPEWNRHETLNIFDYIPESDYKIKEIYTDLLEYITNLPKSIDSYGLVHSDFKKDNFFIDSDNHITIFDFDDCCYDWFISELAWIFFRYIPENNFIPQETFLKEFLSGYAGENRLDPDWLKEIGSFLKMHEISFYALAFLHFDDFDNMPERSRLFMNGRKEKILNDIPYIDIDFEKFGKNLL